LVCSITDNRCPLDDFAATVANTDFDFLPTASAEIFLLAEPTFEVIELTTTLHEYFAQAAAETFNVIIAFVPTRLLVTFAEVFDFTENVAGATEEPNARTPDVDTAATKRMSGIVINQPSIPCTSTDHRVHVIAP
jgi:hypothetical protein